MARGHNRHHILVENQEHLQGNSSSSSHNNQASASLTTALQLQHHHHHQQQHRRPIQITKLQKQQDYRSLSPAHPLVSLYKIFKYKSLVSLKIYN